MRQRYYLIPVIVLFIILILQFGWPSLSGSQTASPEKDSNQKLETKDRNKDGKLDMWLYRDNKGTPLKWIYDYDYDGRPDNWSFFKNGKSYLDEKDTDGDGKVDEIYLSIWDSQGIKQRYLYLVLKDKEKYIFEVQEDTGWLSEDADNKLKKNSR